MSLEHEDFAYKIRPRLFDEFQKAQNSDVEFNDLSRGSTKKVAWKCLLADHPVWMASMGTRVAGHNCPYCSGRFPIVGETDLASQSGLAHLLAEWDFEMNSLSPKDVTPMSSKKVHWIGNRCGHSWQQAISARALGSGCPYCAGVKVLVGFNDLKTTHPDLAELWDSDNLFTPDQITAGSGRKARLIFPCSHIWENKVSEFTRRSLHCPYCAGSLFLPGFNDLETTHPKLASEWHPTKNTLLPSEVMSGSGKKAWWLGLCGHEWEAQINSRKRGNGCGQCNFNGSSKIEQALLKAVRMIIPDAQTGKIPLPDFNRPLQTDIMGTYDSRKIVIEYDGYNWHHSQKDMDLDSKKTTGLLKEGYHVVRVRELIYSRTLPHLRIQHNNLLQVTMKYTPDHRHIGEVVEEIKLWLSGK